MAVQTKQPKRAAKPVDEHQRRRTITDRQSLIDGLNEDLAGELQTILTCLHYASKTTGSHEAVFRKFFESEIADELRHAQFLSDKIVALGGEPTTNARAVPDADGVREMLAHVLRLEQRAIHDYSRRVEQAEVDRELGLKVRLEGLVADETQHKEELERILTGWETV
jgi:bacterioferritin